MPEAVDLAERRGLAAPVTLQPQYNLLVREIEWEVVPACAANGARPAALVAARRRLADRQVHAATQRPTGATRLGEDPERGVEAYDRRSTSERTWDVIDAVRAVADGARRVAWRRSRWPGWSTGPAVTSVILGARTIEQLEDNLGAAGLHLSAEETARLDAASDPAPADYPYGGSGPGPAQPQHLSGRLSRRAPRSTSASRAGRHGRRRSAGGRW